MFGRAAARKIGRTCTQNDPHMTQQARNEAAVRQLRDSHGGIDALLDQIDDAIHEHQSQVDIGVRGQELDHDRLKMQAPKATRCSHCEVAFGGSVFSRDRLFRVPDIVEYARASFVEELSLIRQRKSAG